jgi:hypothetical protein
MYKEIESLLKKCEEFKINQTYGHPFVDFNIKMVGKTFESLIGKTAFFLPSLKTLYLKFMFKNSQQFTEQGIAEQAIYGRVARMWASLVREWHAYYILLEIGNSIYDYDSDDIIRNDTLDTMKGIDIYLINLEKPNTSIKLDIFQSTKRSNQFRKIKDTKRVKDLDIPGNKFQIKLGGDNLETTTQVVNGWYLLKESYAHRIIHYYNNIKKKENNG